MNRLRLALLLVLCIGLLPAAAPAAAASPISASSEIVHVQKSYAFVGGSDGHLWVNWWDGTLWRWSDQGLPPGAHSLLATTSAITYSDATATQHIAEFLTGDNGHLYENYWDGTTWLWYDHGLPPGTIVAGVSSVITYRDANGVQRISVFGSATTALQDHLYERWWDGTSWHWTDHGTGNPAVGDPSAITYLDRDGTQRIYVFYSDGRGDLVVNYWDGRGWHWADQGRAPGDQPVLHASAVSYADSAGAQHIYVFASGANGHLAVNWWDGAAWRWADQGTPTSGSYVSTPSPIVFPGGNGAELLNVFVGDMNHAHLYNNWWDGSTWHWNDQGTQPGATGYFFARAVTSVSVNGSRRIDVFSTSGAGGGHLLRNYWDGSSWNWADQGLAGGSVQVGGLPTVITY